MPNSVFFFAFVTPEKNRVDKEKIGSVGHIAFFFHNTSYSVLYLFKKKYCKGTVYNCLLNFLCKCYVQKICIYMTVNVWVHNKTTRNLQYSLPLQWLPITLNVHVHNNIVYLYNQEDSVISIKVYKVESKFYFLYYNCVTLN